MTSDERRARNEAAFRAANEGIRRAQEGLPHVDGLLPFICECDRTDCKQILHVPVGEYETVRERGTQFLVADGHDGGSTAVVARRDGYMVVDKYGTEGEIAEAENPRTEA